MHENITENITFCLKAGLYADEKSKESLIGSGRVDKRKRNFAIP